MRRSTPLGAVARRSLAAALGTLAMDLLWYKRRQRQGTQKSFVDWETAKGLDNWEDAPVPAQAGRRVTEGLLQRELEPKKWAAPMTNLVHWAYPALWGALYGILAGSARKPKLLYGPPFGAAVWGAGYVFLPPTGLYKPIWEYDRETLWKDLSAHLVFGAGTGLAFRALSIGRKKSA